MGILPSKISILLGGALLFSIPAFAYNAEERNGQSSSVAQQNITGTVSDSEGPLPGLTVHVKGDHSVATSTDGNGKFSLSVPTGSILVFQMVGLKTQELKATSTPMSVLMELSSTDLEDVVVVAFGTQKKTTLTGSVATISSKELVDRPVTSVQNALQGISPGLTVIQRPGDVGRNSDGTSNGTGTVTIRGRSNLGSPGPMYVIDGIPASGQEFASLNANDIASMSVLKDASSASLYGSRAANGVILVTTKRGGGDRAVVSLNMNSGLQYATSLPQYADALTYATLHNEAMTNAGKANAFSDEQIGFYKDGSNPDLYPNTNWQKEILRKSAPQTDINLNINAPGQVTNYYLGLNYLTQASLIPNKTQDRIAAKLNTESTIAKDILKIGTNFSFIKQNYDRDGAALSWAELGRSLPTSVLRHSNGEWGSIDNGSINAQTAGRNQLRLLEEGGSAWDRDNYLQTAINGSLTPLKGLSINGIVSLKYSNTNNWNFSSTVDPINNFLTGNPMASTLITPNEMQETWTKRQELMFQGTIDYERTFADHFGKLTLGASQESNEFRSAFIGRKNFQNNDMTTIGSGSTNPSDISSDGSGQANRTLQTEWALRSFFGRFNYNYQDKYLFEANARMDYSSRFREDLRRAVFPSFSAGWNMSNEAFMDDVNWVDQFKIRGSWGSLGNQDAVPVGNYFALINTGNQYSFDGEPVDGAWQGVGTNPYALWEKVYITDIGIDAVFLSGKLNVTADYYIKNTKDILMRPIVPIAYGFEGDNIPIKNAAETKNRGYEFMAAFNNTLDNGFQYQISGNVSFIKNTILDLDGAYERIDGRWINRLGASVGDYYGYLADGLFSSQEEIDSHPDQSSIAGTPTPGDIRYADVNGDGKLNTDDRTILGNDVPWLNYGFSINAAYKGFTLDVLTYGVSGVKTYLSEEAAHPFFNGANVKEQWLNRWTPENPNPNADFPRITTTTDAKQNYITSSFWLFDGSFFRIRGITLGYTIPEAKISRFGLSNLRVYSSANNPFTFMADKRLADYDPEMGSGRASYPGIKSVTLGISAQF